MFSVKNKHIVVTGASGVLGSTISVALAKSGAHLTLLGRNEQKLKITEEKVKVYGGKYLVRQWPGNNPGTLSISVPWVLFSH